MPKALKNISEDDFDANADTTGIEFEEIEADDDDFALDFAEDLDCMFD